MSIAVEFLDVVKQFPGAVEPAVDHVSFQIQEQEMITILGTSGCGKTTLMKMVNRLYEPTSGEIRIFGENIGQTDAVALRRKIGYVIQQVGLFPHMTVEKNIAVVPEILGWDSAQIHDRVTELLELVNLDPKQYRGRYPSQLSVDSSSVWVWPGHWLQSRRLCCWMSHLVPLMRSIGPSCRTN